MKMSKRLLSMMLSFLLVLPLLQAKAMAGNEALARYTLEGSRSYRLTNNSGSDYSVQTSTENEGCYDYASYCSDGTTNYEHDVLGWGFGFSVPKGGYTDVSASKGTCTILIPHDWNMTVTQISHSALDRYTIDTGRGESYHLTNHSDSDYSVQTSTENEGCYDYASYRSDGTTNYEHDVLGWGFGFSVPKEGYTDVNASKRTCTILIPHDWNMTVTQVSHSALDRYTIDTGRGESYRLTNHSDSDYSVQTSTENEGCYDYASYRCDGTTNYEHDVLGWGFGFSVPKEGYTDVSASKGTCTIFVPYEWNRSIVITDSKGNVLNQYDSIGNSIVPDSSSGPASDYLYDIPDSGADVILDTDRLNTVTDPTAAASAVQSQVQSMTTAQKSSATGVDLATLYAETAAAKAASQKIDSSDLLINASLLSNLQSTSTQAISAVEGALTSGGVTTARELSHTVILTAGKTDVTIHIDPDVLKTDVDRVRVETPDYAITFKLADLEPDLTQTLTFSAKSVAAASTAISAAVSSFSGSADGQAGTISKSILANAAVPAVEINMTGGKTTNSITVSLPSGGGDTTYRTVTTSDGTATASKYNPATTMMDGKVNTSGTYTVKSNEKDFTDIADKSAEMQKAIRYLASKGIINGTTPTTFSPDGNINRAEIATLLVKALGKLDSTATASFSDMTKGNWFYTAAASSWRHKLINGYEDNTFRGSTNISKVQIVAVSSRVLKTEMGYKVPASPATYLSKFSDAIDSWAQSEVALATRENLVVYRTDGTFSGDKTMTRGDAAIIIYRLFQRIW